MQPSDLYEIAQAVTSLEVARSRLRRAGAHHAASYAQRALKSAQGSFRRAQRMVSRDEEPIPPCAASMGCLCAGHARGNPADAACDTSE